MTIPVNRESLDWQTLRRRGWAEIEKHRAELESLDCTHDRANQLRGMIDALRSQEQDVEPTPKPDVVEPKYGY